MIEKCYNCPSFLGHLDDGKDLTGLHCREKGNRPCCDQVSLNFGECPKGLWTSSFAAKQRDIKRAGDRAITPYLVHVGWKQPQWQRMCTRLAEKLGLGYTHVLVEDNVFRTATQIKYASLAIIWNGLQHYSPLAKKMCQVRSIPYLVYEWGLLPQSTTFLSDPSGFVGDSVLCGDLSWVTDADRKVLKVTRENLQRRYPLDPQPKRIVVLLQIENDSQLLFHSSYNRMDDFVERVRNDYPDHDIVVRNHPKTKKTKTLDDRLDMLDQARYAELVVAITSTGLYEAAILGVKVRAYGNHPVNYHQERIDELAAGVLALRLDRETGDMTTILDRFDIKPKVWT